MDYIFQVCPCKLFAGEEEKRIPPIGIYRFWGNFRQSTSFHPFPLWSPSQERWCQWELWVQDLIRVSPSLQWNVRNASAWIWAATPTCKQQRQAVRALQRNGILSLTHKFTKLHFCSLQRQLRTPFSLGPEEKWVILHGLKGSQAQGKLGCALGSQAGKWQQGEQECPAVGTQVGGGGSQRGTEPCDSTRLLPDWKPSMPEGSELFQSSCVWAGDTRHNRKRKKKKKEKAFFSLEFS